MTTDKDIVQALQRSTESGLVPWAEDSDDSKVVYTAMVGDYKFALDSGSMSFVLSKKSGETHGYCTNEDTDGALPGLVESVKRSLESARMKKEDETARKFSALKDGFLEQLQQLRN